MLWYSYYKIMKGMLHERTGNEEYLQDIPSG